MKFNSLQLIYIGKDIISITEEYFGLARFV